jgi:hypothetical protein
VEWSWLSLTLINYLRQEKIKLKLNLSALSGIL